MTYLITGAAGFIGMHVARALLERGETVIGFDNLNAYYDITFKQARINQLSPYETFTFVKGDIADEAALTALFAAHNFTAVIHLAAQAGVRYSLDNPQSYIRSNIHGFANILEVCRHNGAPHLIYASSSSVYGGNTHTPFSENDRVDHPVSLYAATKKSNELMAHSYAHLYNMAVTGLRFFTVYGPWGRPDMAPYIFTQKIMAREPITVFNHGHHARDFTYIDDITAGVLLCLPHKGDVYRLYNIGRGQSVELMDFIGYIEQATGQKAIINFADMQAGDVQKTHADISQLQMDLGYKPQISIQQGVERFIDWYKSQTV